MRTALKSGMSFMTGIALLASPAFADGGCSMPPGTLSSTLQPICSSLQSAKVPGAGDCSQSQYSGLSCSSCVQALAKYQKEGPGKLTEFGTQDASLASAVSSDASSSAASSGGSQLLNMFGGKSLNPARTGKKSGAGSTFVEDRAQSVWVAPIPFNSQSVRTRYAG